VTFIRFLNLLLRGFSTYQRAQSNSLRQQRLELERERLDLAKRKSGFYPSSTELEKPTKRPFWPPSDE
jgi:hypothetical protein